MRSANEKTASVRRAPCVSVCAHDWLAPRLQGRSDNFKIKPDWRGAGAGTGACGSAIASLTKRNHKENKGKEAKLLGDTARRLRLLFIACQMFV